MQRHCLARVAIPRFAEVLPIAAGRAGRCRQTVPRLRLAAADWLTTLRIVFAPFQAGGSMPDTIRKVDYFSLQVSNKPGEAFNVLSALVSSGINLLACTGFPRGRRAQIDVIPDDTRKFNAAAKKAGLAFNPKKTGFLIQGEDRPGALAEHLGKLADDGINVTAIEAVAAGEGRYGAILWVKPEDVTRAGKRLGAA